MCGLAGLLGQELISEDLEAFEELMTMTTFRGYDSYGLFSYTPFGQTRKDPYRIKKDIGTAAGFMMDQKKLKRDDRFIKTIYTEAFLGHARWATKGNINRENAHPFDTGRYVSIHNGTLKDDRFKDNKKTDSQMMFELMEKEGIIPVLSSINPFDAYAVAIFDKEDKTVTLARNTNRPLYVGMSSYRGSLFFSSEIEMLQLIGARKREPFMNSIDMDFFSLLPNRAYKIDLRKIRARNHTPWTVTEWKSPKISLSGKKVKEAPPFDQDLLSKYSIRQEVESPVDYSLSGITDFFDTDEECSVCGEVLYGLKLQKSVPNTLNGRTYFTCEACQNAQNNAVKSGPKMSA